MTIEANNYKIHQIRIKKGLKVRVIVIIEDYVVELTEWVTSDLFSEVVIITLIIEVIVVIMTIFIFIHDDTSINKDNL